MCWICVRSKVFQRIPRDARPGAQAWLHLRITLGRCKSDPGTSGQTRRIRSSGRGTLGSAPRCFEAEPGWDLCLRSPLLGHSPREAFGPNLLHFPGSLPVPLCEPLIWACGWKRGPPSPNICVGSPTLHLGGAGPQGSRHRTLPKVFSEARTVWPPQPPLVPWGGTRTWINVIVKAIFLRSGSYKTIPWHANYYNESSSTSKGANLIIGRAVAPRDSN